MKISKYDTTFSFENALVPAAFLIQRGQMDGFPKVFHFLPKTEFSRISGIKYARVKLICRKPQVVRDDEIQKITQALPGCTENMVRGLFGLPGILNPSPELPDGTASPKNQFPHI